MKINIASTEIIHFIGIGGIGMSGLAQIMHNMGFKVQGSDLSFNKNIERLANLKIKIFNGHNKKNISTATMIVTSSAVKKNNIELVAARKKKLPIFKRGEMLANIVSLKKNIVVTGSHGKTTTTSLIANILAKAGLDPTVINGGVINSIKSSAKLGRGEWAVIESDESDGSFLNLPVTYSIVTNVDHEHLDYYKNFNNLKKNFLKFIEKTPKIGKAIICLDDKNLRDIIKKSKNKSYLTYGFNRKSDYQILKVKKGKISSKFDLMVKVPGKSSFKIKNIIINLLGDHNVSNAAAAFALGVNLGIKIKVLKNALRKVSGIQRRFTKVFSIENKDFYDDYAHHPTEIKAVLNGAREVYGKREIVSVFQPHRFSRVKLLKEEFAKSFKLSNKVVLCPVYSAGEKIDRNFSQYQFSKLIGRKSKVQVINVNNQNEIKYFFKKNLLNNEMVICMGAGSISNWIRKIVKEL